MCSNGAHSSPRHSLHSPSGEQSSGTRSSRRFLTSFSNSRLPLWQAISPPPSGTNSLLASCSSVLYSPHSGKVILLQLQLSELLNLEKPWTLIIDDAMASSFVSPTTDAIEDDTRLIVEEYLRTWEQNEELGLNDMDTSTADNAYNTSTD